MDALESSFSKMGLSMLTLLRKIPMQTEKLCKRSLMKGKIFKILHWRQFKALKVEIQNTISKAKMTRIN